MELCWGGKKITLQLLHSPIVTAANGKTSDTIFKKKKKREMLIHSYVSWVFTHIVAHFSHKCSNILIHKICTSLLWKFFIIVKEFL